MTGCDYCEAGPEDECTDECPSRNSVLRNEALCRCDECRKIGFKMMWGYGRWSGEKGWTHADGQRFKDSKFQ